MTTAPTVSVIMSAYNGSHLIGETIDKLLAQTFTDFELVVVDDASTDDTLALLRSIGDPRVRVIASEKNGGPIAARNRAFAEARGHYIAGLDQDDLCHPERLERQVAFLDAHPDVVLAATAVSVLQEDGRVEEDYAAPAITSPALIGWMMLFHNPLTWSSVMLRADAARRLDVFERSEIPYAEDFDLYHRMARLGTVARVDMPLLTYRRHGGGVSRQCTDRMTASATAVLAEAYQPIFGIEAHAAASKAIRQLGGCEPATSAAELAQLARIMERVHCYFVGVHKPSEADLALILPEYSRLWWRIAEGVVRQGKASLTGAVSSRPEGTRLRRSSPGRLMMSGLIGGSRAIRASIAR